MDWKELAVVFFYNQIRGFAESFIGSFMGLPVDIVLAIIGWWKKNTWWGRGLLYGAVAMLGSSGGLGLGGFFQPPASQPHLQPAKPSGAKSLALAYAST